MMPGTDSRTQSPNGSRRQAVSSPEYSEILLEDSLQDSGGQIRKSGDRERQAALRAQIAQRDQRIAELEARNAELEGYAYTVSHDLKAPLVTIKGFISFLRRDVLVGDQKRTEHDLERISYAADRMQCLLDDLLELARVGRAGNQPQKVAFAELANEALERLAGSIEGCQGKVLVAPSLPEVYGDRSLFVDAIEKLLDNAVKHADDGAAPCIEIGARQESESLSTEDTAPVFFVRDNGPGIHPRFHDQVFQLFERLDPEASDGTGVGLTLVKRIIELHGGRIWIESTGPGTTMCFTLPSV